MKFSKKTAKHRGKVGEHHIKGGPPAVSPPFAYMDPHPSTTSTEFFETVWQLGWSSSWDGQFYEEDSFSKENVSPAETQATDLKADFQSASSNNNHQN